VRNRNLRDADVQDVVLMIFVAKAAEDSNLFSRNSRAICQISPGYHQKREDAESPGYDHAAAYGVI
jgi:hypothetical protein